MHGPLIDAAVAPLHEIDGSAEEHCYGMCGILLYEIDVANPIELDHEAIPLARPARQDRLGDGIGCITEHRGCGLQQRSHDSSSSCGGGSEDVGVGQRSATVRDGASRVPRARRSARDQNMCCPPLMAMLAPVTNAASSDAR